MVHPSLLFPAICSRKEKQAMNTNRTRTNCVYTALSASDVYCKKCKLFALDNCILNIISNSFNFLVFLMIQILSDKRFSCPRSSEE